MTKQVFHGWQSEAITHNHPIFVRQLIHKFKKHLILRGLIHKVRGRKVDNAMDQALVMLLTIMVGNASGFSTCPPKIGVNIGRIERGLVVMGCVVDVVWGVMGSIKRGHVEKHWHS